MKKTIALTLLSTLFCCSSALASISLEPIANQAGVTWVDGSQFQDSLGVWWFEIVTPPNSNDVLAFTAVGAFQSGVPIIKDDDNGAGNTTGGILNGEAIDVNGSDISRQVFWEATFLPDFIAFKAGSDFYTVWEIEDADFDMVTGLYSQTIDWGYSDKFGSNMKPPGMSHTSAQSQIPEPTTLMIWGGFAALGFAGFRRKK